MERKKSRALSLIEVILAMWILFIAICFIFEVLRTSYTYVNKLKIISHLGTLSTSKLETILYENYLNETPNVWKPFPGDNEYLYLANITLLHIDQSCPGYRMYQVDLFTKGPIGRPTIKEYNMSLSTLLIDYQQTITTTSEKRWGEGLSPEAGSR